MSIELFRHTAEQAPAIPQNEQKALLPVPPAIPPRHWWVWEDVSFLNCHRIHPMQQRKVQQLIEQAEQNANIRRLTVFGSSVNNSCHSGSDVDIYCELLTDRPLGLSCDFKMDLFTSFSVDERMLQEIRSKGVVVYVQGFEHSVLQRRMHGEDFLQRFVRDAVRELSVLYGDQLKKVILYGSYARGDYDAESDINLLVLLDGSQAEKSELQQMPHDLCNQLGDAYDIFVNLRVEELQHYNNYTFASPYCRIQKEGVILYERE